MQKIVKTFVVAVLIVLALTGARASVITAPGYSVKNIIVDMPDYAFLGGFDVLPNGNYVVNDGHSIREVKRDGTTGEVFYSYDTAVFGSFVRVNNNTLYFGDSSTESNKIISKSLFGGSATTLTTISGSYDMDFCNGVPYLVAGNSIYKIGTDGSLDTIAAVNGYSGPLAFDNEGNLYYSPGHVASDYTPLPTTIMKWSSEQVDSAIGDGMLSESEALVLSQANGAYGFAFDSNENFLVTDNSSNPVVNVLNDGALSPIATFNVKNTHYPSLTFIRSRPDGVIAVGCSYYDSDWISHTLICEMQEVPEPSSVIALFSMFGLAASTRLLRRGKVL